MTLHSLWFINKRENHGCGPIKNGESGWTPVENWITHDDTVISYPYTLVTLFPFLWLLLSYIVTLGYIKGHEADVLQQYELDKKEENMAIITDNG